VKPKLLVVPSRVFGIAIRPLVLPGTGVLFSD
jgi:hypothetical protein